MDDNNLTQPAGFGNGGEALDLTINVEGADPVRTTVDLWDLGQSDYLQNSNALPEPGQMSQTQVANDGGGDETKKKLLAILVFALVVGAGAYFFLFDQEDDFLTEVGGIDSLDTAPFDQPQEPGVFDKVLSFVGLGDTPDPLAVPPTQSPQTTQVQPTPVQTTPKKVVNVQVTEVKESQLDNAPIIEIVEGNPYWILPNQMQSRDPGLKRSWGAHEEDEMRRRLRSPYTYQRYKVVQDIRIKKLKGSEVILFEALKEKKFWTRMAALIGIAEFGYPVDLATVDQVLKGAREDTVANYFKRFRLKPTGAELFILRHALKLVGETARLHILQSLYRAPNDLNKLYIMASTYDPSPRVGKWVNRAINRIRTNASQMGLFDRVIRGLERAPSNMLSDDVIAQQVTQYELERAKEIQLFGAEDEAIVTSDPDDGFEELEVIEIKGDQF